MLPKSIQYTQCLHCLHKPFTTDCAKLRQRLRRQRRRYKGMHLLPNGAHYYILTCVLTLHADTLNENNPRVNFYFSIKMKIRAILFSFRALNENKKHAYFHFAV